MHNYLIIGSNSSIGRAVSTQLRGLGEQVVGVSRSTGPAEQPTISCDFRKPEQVDLAIDEAVLRFGRFDSIIFCQRFRPTKKVRGHAWEDEINVNAIPLSAFLSRHSSLFKKKGLRSVVVISSLSSVNPTLLAPLEYQSSKALLESIARYYARALGPQGIRVNIVCPYFIEKSKHRVGTSSKVNAQFAKSTVLRRSCEAKEIAAPVIFLSSEGSSFITGIALTIDGGASLMVYPK